MKHIIIKSCLLLAALLASAGMQAQIYATIDNMVYTLNQSDTTASLRESYDKLAHSIVVPASIKYHGRTYTVTSIGNRTFGEFYTLTTLTLPETLTYIEYGAFKNCSSLTHIICLSTDPQSIKGTKGCWAPEPLSDAIIHVKPGTAQAYRQADTWKDFNHIEENIGAIHFVEIDSIAYYLDDTKKTASVMKRDNYYGGNLIIPDTVTYNGEEYSITEIEHGALYIGRDDFTSITLPAGLKKINQFALCGTAHIHCLSSIPPYIAPNALKGSPVLHTAEASRKAYKENDVWNACRIVSDLTMDKMVIIDERGYQLTDGEKRTATLFFDNRIKRCRTLIDKITYTNGKRTILDGNGSPIANSNIKFPDYVSYNGKQYIVTRIADYAFEYCKRPRLINLTLPQSLEYIGEGAFCACNLVSVTIPQDVAYIGNRVFSSCFELAKMEVASENQHFTCIDGAIYTTNRTELVTYHGNGTEIRIPEGVVKIRQGAFEGSRLKSIILPQSLTTIEDMAFANSSLESITLPKSISHIGSAAFLFNFNLAHIFSDIDNPQNVKLNTYPFDENTYSNATLHVKEGKKKAYRQAEGWKKFMHIVY